MPALNLSILTCLWMRAEPGPRREPGASGVVDMKKPHLSTLLWSKLDIKGFGMLYSENKLRDFIDHAPILPPGSVVRTGKDVRGFYPGQVGRVHKEYLTRGAPGPFSKLQPAPLNYEAETLFQPDFDNSALRSYVYFQQMKKPTIDWYSQTSYRAAFDLPYHYTTYYYPVIDTLQVHSKTCDFGLTKHTASGRVVGCSLLPPQFHSCHESKYTPVDSGPHIIWTSTGRRMFSTFQACT